MITVWLFNIAMENGPFIDGLPIKLPDGTTNKHKRCHCPKVNLRATRFEEATGRRLKTL